MKKGSSPRKPLSVERSPLKAPSSSAAPSKKNRMQEDRSYPGGPPPMIRQSREAAEAAITQSQYHGVNVDRAPIGHYYDASLLPLDVHIKQEYGTEAAQPLHHQYHQSYLPPNQEYGASF